MTSVHVVLPDGVDDPARPSGGNRYDRRLCDGLAAAGWRVHEVVVRGAWPHPDGAALDALAAGLAARPDDALVLVDGLIAAAAGRALHAERDRLRLVVLLHMPFGDVEVPASDEARALRAARAVVTTSAWTRTLLLDRYALDQVAVVPPGADPAELAPGTEQGGQLLCVAALAPHKGQDVLLAALGRLAEQNWHCTLAGPTDRDPPFADRIRQGAAALGGRVTLRGSRRPEELRHDYAAADLVVVPSRLEAYGMVVTEALAAGLPVVASAVGGIPEALGTTPSGLPGVLVPPGDPAALRSALDEWLTDPEQRHARRRAARQRRKTLEDWTTTTERVAAVLTRVNHEPAPARVPR